MAAKRSGVDGAEVGRNDGGEGERGGDEEWRRGEERLDRDTRLSRAFVPKTAGPLLRSS